MSKRAAAAAASSSLSPEPLTKKAAPNRAAKTVRNAARKPKPMKLTEEIKQENTTGAENGADPLLQNAVKAIQGVQDTIENVQESITKATKTPATKARARVKKETPVKEAVKVEATDDTEAVEDKKPKKKPTKSSIAAKKGIEEVKAFVAAQQASDPKPADPDGNDDTPEEPEQIKLQARRPPPVNTDYLPLPWKGRLGYACLNTYLRDSFPPIFCSRTCRISSILDHRYPLEKPDEPEHAIKNRPDKTKEPDVARGQRYVESIGLANVRDLPKMLLWNDKYNIKFMRLSSEMFPFASHEEYGYKIAPFAAKELEEVGKVAARLGHRLTAHPGQFTQLGSPRPSVITSALRDLEYQNEVLSLLKLPEQMNKDAVMILHLGGVFGDKAATIERFKMHYATLSQEIKDRLVLENDDVSWSVHELLPVCEELNIPLCLDFHHHNIIFDEKQIREGSHDIMALLPRIAATWTRKGIKQKMHYSEPCPSAITGTQRRKHNPRPQTMPPCPPDMDLMIEAKDKEQAVFEMMKTYRLPGWNTFNAIVPYERDDHNKEVKVKKGQDPIVKDIVPEEEVGMGGPDNRVYWPPGMDEWLRPKKREIKKKAGPIEHKAQEDDEEEEGADE